MTEKTNTPPLTMGLDALKDYLADLGMFSEKAESAIDYSDTISRKLFNEKNLSPLQVSTIGMLLVANSTNYTVISGPGKNIEDSHKANSTAQKNTLAFLSESVYQLNLIPTLHGIAVAAAMMLFRVEAEGEKEERCMIKEAEGEPS